MLDYADFIQENWFLERHLVSDGFDAALDNIKRRIPEMVVERYRSGTEAWTWTVPEKWSVKAAHIKANGRTLVDIKDHPLHIMSYSAPFSGVVSREELMKHLFTRPQFPDLIPFEFSYYVKKWGFCVPHRRLSEFTDKEYEVLIDSKFETGEMKVGNLYLPGETSDEIVIMAHLCHPCMVDDDLTGVAVLLRVAETLMKRSTRYSYRFLILPETIGSIAFFSHNEHLLGNMKFGMFLEMLGNKNNISLQKSRQGDTLLDRASQLALRSQPKPYRIGDFREVIGNDEKVLNGPGLNVPTISLSRSNFMGKGEWPYPEYHSHMDTPKIISVERLEEAERLALSILDYMEANYYPVARKKGPIFLSRYGLWVDWRENLELNIKQDLVFYYLHGGEKSLIDIAYELELPYPVLKEWLDKYLQHDLIDAVRK